VCVCALCWGRWDRVQSCGALLLGSVDCCARSFHVQAALPGHMMVLLFSCLTCSSSPLLLPDAAFPLLLIVHRTHIDRLGHCSQFCREFLCVTLPVSQLVCARPIAYAFRWTITASSLSNRQTHTETSPPKTQTHAVI